MAFKGFIMASGLYHCLPLELMVHWYGSSKSERVGGDVNETVAYKTWLDIFELLQMKRIQHHLLSESEYTVQAIHQREHQ